MSTFEERQARTQEMQAAIQSGSIGSATSAKLSEYIAWLSDPAIQGCFNGQAYPQTCETVRLHMLRSMIEGFEERGKTMQWWVVALAVAAFVTSMVQTVVSIRAEFRTTAESALSAQPHQAAPSNPASTPVVDIAPPTASAPPVTASAASKKAPQK